MLQLGKISRRVRSVVVWCVAIDKRCRSRLGAAKKYGNLRESAVSRVLHDIIYRSCSALVVFLESCLFARRILAKTKNSHNVERWVKTSCLLGRLLDSGQFRVASHDGRLKVVGGIRK